jgi:predicted hydrocarbon binding protein
MISKEEAITRLIIIRAEYFEEPLKLNSREDVREVIGKYLEAIDMAIEALSPPERPKGRWKSYEIDGLPHLTVYQCSECGRFEEVKEPYCHCGAEMVRGEEE